MALASATSGRRRRPGPATGREPTIRDVARLADVSVATVSRVLAGKEKVRPATEARVTAAIAELGFVVNGFARALTGQGPQTVAVVTSGMLGPLFADLASGAEEVATRRGFLFMLATTHGEAAREDAVISQLCQMRAGVVILAGAVIDGPGYVERIGRYEQELSRYGGRLVLCGRPAVPELPVPALGYDNVESMCAVVDHLIGLGHRRILYLGADTTISTARERANGYLAAMRAAGLEVDPDLLPGTGFGPDAGYDGVQAALGRGVRFTAAVCGTDIIAVGALRALRERSLRVPEDVSLTGFDDIPLVADLTPGLTTVRVPFAELGRQAALMGLDGGSGPSDQLLPFELVVRDSTAPPPV